MFPIVGQLNILFEKMKWSIAGHYEREEINVQLSDTRKQMNYELGQKVHAQNRSKHVEIQEEDLEYV